MERDQPSKLNIIGSARKNTYVSGLRMGREKMLRADTLVSTSTDIKCPLKHFQVIH